MKSKFLTLVFLMALPNMAIFAQSSKTLQLDEGCKLFNSVAINNGLILLTGKEYFFNPHLDWNINYYYPDLTLRYKIAIPKPQLNFSTPGRLVVSPSGNHVYYLQYGSRNGNKMSITHLDSLGVSSNFTIKRQYQYNRINVVFADDEYLYYVTKEKDKDKSRRHKKKSFPKLQFVRVAHDNTVTKVMLELPDPDADATEWSYLGHTTEVSYFVSKTIEDEKKAEYRIAVVDADGKLEDDFKMEVNLKDGEFRAGYNYTNAPGTFVVNDHNYTVTSQSYTNASGGTTTTYTYTANPEAFGNIMYDQQTGGFYVYGLSGPKYVKTRRLFAPVLNPIANNFYVFKFDQDGKKSWDYQGKLAGMNDFFTSKATFMMRPIKLNYGVGNTIRFQTLCGVPHGIFTRPTYEANTYEINNETGKYLTGYMNEFQNPPTPIDFGTCHKSGDKSDVGKFMSKKVSGECSVEVFKVNNVNVVVRNYYDDYKLELYGFVDEQ